MASLSHRSGRWVLSFYTADKRKRSLWLGEMSKRAACNAKRHVEELVRAQKANIRPEADTELWVKGLKGRLRDALVKFGLCKPTDERLKLDEARLLGPFMDAYIKGRTDCKPNSLRNLKQARRELVEFFGESYLLTAISPADGERWKRSMLAKPLSPASVSIHVKRAKTMFAAAAQDKFIESSPFVGLKAGNETNPGRLRLISREVAATVLNACPDATWKLIFSLARFGGLRSPSEIVGLRWSDVDWTCGKLRIDSPKTGLRYCPLFPELRTAFKELREEAAADAELCISRYRSSENLRTQFQRILEAAGVTPWPRLFQNLRATRRTELQENYPSHVIDAWMGHSTRVAERHYLLTTDEHWAKATAEPLTPPDCSTGTSICARPEPSGAITEEQKPNENAGFAEGGEEDEYPRQGSRNCQKPMGNKRFAAQSVLPAQSFFEKQPQTESLEDLRRNVAREAQKAASHRGEPLSLRGQIAGLLDRMTDEQLQEALSRLTEILTDTAAADVG